VSPSTDNRKHLLSCALRLFVARGYEGVCVQEIVEAAGVTKPTLYHYFGSKRGLLEALLEDGLAELHRQLAVAADYQHDLPKTLPLIARVYFDFAKSHRELYRMLLCLWFAPLESEAYRTVVRFHQSQFDLVARVFRQAEADHGNMKGRHRAYALTFIGLLNNYVSAALNGYAHLDDQLMRQAVHQFMHGIFS
jgi:TetR/AcrR family transcriptional regulator